MAGVFENECKESYWNWYGFPGVYTASYILIEIVSFVLVGVIAALVLRKRSPAV